MGLIRPGALGGEFSGQVELLLQPRADLGHLLDVPLDPIQALLLVVANGHGARVFQHMRERL